MPTEPEIDWLVSPEDIQGATAEPLDATSLNSIAEQATDAVREFCLWRVAPPAEETIVVTGKGAKQLYLPTMHINTVVSITDDGTVLTEGTDFEWEDFGLIERIGGCWSSRRRGVTVVINHGYPKCPGSISQAVVAAVGRGSLAPAGGVVSVGYIGSNAVFSRASAGGPAAGAIFLPHEIANLERFRPPQSR